MGATETSHNRGVIAGLSIHLATALVERSRRRVALLPNCSQVVRHNFPGRSLLLSGSTCKDPPARPKSAFGRFRDRS